MSEPLPGGRRVPVSSPLAATVLSAPLTEPEPNLRDWLAVVRRHIRLAAGVAAAVVAVTIYLVYTAQAVYRATSVVRLVNARRALVGGLVDGGEEPQTAPWSADPVLSQVEVLRSRATAGALRLVIARGPQTTVLFV